MKRYIVKLEGRGNNRGLTCYTGRYGIVQSRAWAWEFTDWGEADEAACSAHPRSWGAEVVAVQATPPKYY